ncbi:MAG: hypothetical protein AAF363_16820 [Bacteroidota bacterium]
MMIRKKIVLKSISIYLLLQMILDITLPTISYALTSGPTAPEATSFEPIDTTDMVNLITGDFTYNTPLLEVPGPAGGYPLSLSYHAGIQSQEEASWVGLGWTLNPGAITRSVNGYPDDFNMVENTERRFWEGGKTTTWNVGVSVGIAGGPSVSAGLAFSQDTYQGFGWGGSLGVNAGLGENGSGPLGAGGSIGISPYGGFYGSVGVSVGKPIGENLIGSIGGSIGFSGNGVSGGASGGISYSVPNKNGSNEKGLRNGRTSGSLLGASISSSPSGTSGGVGVGGGSTGVHNSKSGIVSTSSKSTSVTIPTPFGINFRLGKTTVRYWIDQTANVGVNGTLHSPVTLPGENDVAFDTYDLPDPSRSLEDFANSEKSIGGTFPDYDNYSVNAQGLSGNFRPYHFRKVLYRQNKVDDASEDQLVKNYNISPLGSSGRSSAIFRFIGDFSNTLRYEENDLDDFGTTRKFEYDFNEGSLYEGERPGERDGSKHIEFFTNDDIINDNASVLRSGFIDTRSKGFSRKASGAFKEQIGSFKITNESGVTYHYSLPAYVKDEYVYSENTDDKDVESFNNLYKKHGYAYTWFLTGITGPDFVDRNSNGFLDDTDWGYWVRFDYGLWTDDYDWRNPSKGFHKDFDTEYRNFSKGKKDVYYLNYI